MRCALLDWLRLPVSALSAFFLSEEQSMNSELVHSGLGVRPDAIVNISLRAPLCY